MKNFRFIVWGIFLLVPSLLCSAQTQMDSLTIVKAKWQKEKHAKGLKFMHASFPSLYGAPQDVYMVDVKLKKHTADVCTHKGRELTTIHAQAEKAVAAINGTFFDMRRGGSVCFVARKGNIDAWTGGGGGKPRSNGAIEMKGKDVRIIPWTADSEKNYNAAGKSIMASGPLLMVNGKRERVDLQQGHDPARHPRTAVMLTKKNHLLLIVVDGRHKGVAEGMTLSELEYFCNCLGATSALNLDGGGSSVLWTAKKGILNTPSDGKERTVANSILVY